jgi:hypothetical protein
VGCPDLAECIDLIAIGARIAVTSNQDVGNSIVQQLQALDGYRAIVAARHAPGAQPEAGVIDLAALAAIETLDPYDPSKPSGEVIETLRYIADQLAEHG